MGITVARGTWTIDAPWIPHMPYDDLEIDPPMSSRAKAITAVVVIGIVLLIVVAVLS